jgi:hypothetical protein
MDFDTRLRRTRGYSNSFLSRAARKILELLYFMVLSAKMAVSFRGDCTWDSWLPQARPWA